MEYAPEANCDKTYVLHDPPVEINAGSTYTVKATIVSTKTPDVVNVYIGNGFGFFRRFQVIPMKRISGYNYEAEMPAELVKNAGQLSYYITVTEKGISRTYTSGLDKIPSDWDFYANDPWQINVMDSRAAVCLFDSERDKGDITGGYFTATSFSPSIISGKSMLHINVNNLKSGQHNAIRNYIGDKVTPRLASTGSMDELVVYGNSLTNKPRRVQLALIMEDGSAYGGTLVMEAKEGLYKLSIKDIAPVKTPILPGTVPFFQSIWFEPASYSKLDLTKIETLLISIGPGIPESEYEEVHGVAIGRVILQHSREAGKHE